MERRKGHTDTGRLPLGRIRQSAVLEHFLRAFLGAFLSTSKEALVLVQLRCRRFTFSHVLRLRLAAMVDLLY